MIQTQRTIAWTSPAALRALIVVLPLVAPVVPAMWVDATAGNVLMERIISLLFIIALSVVIIEKDREKLLWIFASPISIFASIYIACALSSFLFVTAPQYIEHIPSLVIYGYLPILFFPLVLRNPRDLYPGLVLSVICATGFSLYNISVSVPNLSSITPLHGAGVLHKNLIGDVGATAALICLSFLMTKRSNRITQLGLSIIILIGFFSCFTANARACMISLPSAALCIGFAQIRKRGWLKILVPGVLAFLLLVGAFALAPKEKVESLTATEEGSSAAARPFLWDLSWKFLSARPLQPVGFRQPIVLTEINQPIENPCNFFLQQWIELGLWAAIPYTAMIIAGLVTSFKACTRTTENNWDDLAFIAAICLSLQILKFLREVQDSCAIGATWGMSLPNALGITVFVHLVLKKHQKLLHQSLAGGGES